MTGAWIDPRHGALPALWLQYAMLSGPDDLRARLPPPSPPAHVVVALETPPAPPPTPAPAAAPGDALPRRGLLGVAESHDGAVAVTWSARAVYVTRDAGATWRRALERAGRVMGAVVKGDGTVQALRSPRSLGVLGADGVERWRTTPRPALHPDDDAALRAPMVAAAAEGARAAWLVINTRGGEGLRARWLGVTDDDGLTWRTTQPPVTTDGGLVDVTPEGEVRAVLWESDCSYDAVNEYRWRDGARALRPYGRAFAREPIDAWFDRDGWFVGELPVAPARAGAAWTTRTVVWDLARRAHRPSRAELHARQPWWWVQQGRLRRRAP